MIFTSLTGFCSKTGEVMDIIEDVQETLQRTSIQSGLATVFVPGATGAVTTFKFESGSIEDLKEALQRLAPDDIDYSHNLR